MTRTTLVLALATAALACPPVWSRTPLKVSRAGGLLPRGPGADRRADAEAYRQESNHRGHRTDRGHGSIVYFETYGAMDRESRKAMPKDAIFRIYSMTKAVTGVAVMILHDEGKFALSDPVARYLPEFASPKVAVDENDSESGKRKVRLVDAERAITILDLLRHTSGITYQGPRDQDGASTIASSVTATPARISKRWSRSWPGLRSFTNPAPPGSTVIRLTSWAVSSKSSRARRSTGSSKPGSSSPWEWGTRDSTSPSRNGTGWSPSTPPTPTRQSGDPRAGPGSVQEAANLVFRRRGTRVNHQDYARFCQMLLNDGELDGGRMLSKPAVR